MLVSPVSLFIPPFLSLSSFPSLHSSPSLPLLQVSPLVSYSGEGLEFLAGAKLQPPVHVELKGEGAAAAADNEYALDGRVVVVSGLVER